MSSWNKGSRRVGLDRGPTRSEFGGEDLYPTLAEKAAAVGHALIQNHFLGMVISLLVMVLWCILGAQLLRD
jgi:hypothetical protein